MQGMVILSDCPKIKVAAMGLGVKDLAINMAASIQHVVMAFEWVGANAWVSGCGMMGRQSVGKGQRYVQKELLPPKAG
jgi:hypothetical protein